MNLIERVKSPTPKFFTKLRNIGLAATALGTAVLAQPIAFPALLIKVAGYLLAGGAAVSMVSQSVTKTEGDPGSNTE